MGYYPWQNLLNILLYNNQVTYITKLNGLQGKGNLWMWGFQKSRSNTSPNRVQWPLVL